MILNKDALTLMQPPGRRKFIIDLLMASSGLALIASSKTKEDPYNSDHYLISVFIGGKVNSAHQFCYKLKLKARKN